MRKLQTNAYRNLSQLTTAQLQPVQFQNFKNNNLNIKLNNSKNNNNFDEKKQFFEAHKFCF